MAKELSHRQAKFVEEYLKDLNATQAAIRAGYSPVSARNVGSQLLTKPHVVAALKPKQERQLKRIGMTADQVLEGLARIALADVRQLADEDGNPVPLHKLPDAIALSLAGVEPGDGAGIKAKLNDRLKALEILAKHYHLLVDRVEVEHSVKSHAELVQEAMKLAEERAKVADAG